VVVPEIDALLAHVIGRHLDGDQIANQKPDAVRPQTPGTHGEDRLPVVEEDACHEASAAARPRRRRLRAVLGHSELRAKSSPPERGAVPCRSAGPQVRSRRLALPTVFEVELDLLAFDDLLQL
jgi:hypothetical protein